MCLTSIHWHPSASKYWYEWTQIVRTIFLQGSPVLDEINGILFGRLSGIVAHHIPSYLKKNNLPSAKTNSIEDWEEKVNEICNETIGENMTTIGGIPSWVQMYFEKLLKKSSKKNIIDLFKNLSLYIYGGVNFSPYEKTFNNVNIAYKEKLITDLFNKF